ncbi:hypothetical protein PIB30_085470 [Stylosanthes scabra]|uniref:Uncharacterized protein n=1 Tax=Stylosanthes scabra TaxID=79078 RepID=A0ABU6QSE1_9FABA|nr:hypothetical protein [Stylosanthes scabra]
MACKGPSPTAKGKGKAYGPPTRASPRLAALRSQSATKPQPETPVTPTCCHCAKTELASQETSYPKAPKEQEVIAVSSDSEPEPEIAGENEDVGEDPEEGPGEAHQDTEMEEEEEEEDPKEDPEEENVAEEGVHEEDDFADHWALVRSDSEDSIGNDYRFWNYDGDLPNWGKRRTSRQLCWKLHKTSSSTPLGA